MTSVEASYWDANESYWLQQQQQGDTMTSQPDWTFVLPTSSVASLTTSSTIATPLTSPRSSDTFYELQASTRTSDARSSESTTSRSRELPLKSLTNHPDVNRRQSSVGRIRKSPAASAASRPPSSPSSSVVTASCCISGRPYTRTTHVANDDVTQTRRIRYEYNCIQRQMLRDFYEQGHTPTDSQLDDIASQLRQVFGADQRLDKMNVRVWFQNRRREDRQQRQRATSTAVKSVKQSASNVLVGCSTLPKDVLDSVKRLNYICF